MSLSENDLVGVYGRRYANFRRGAAAIVGDHDIAHDIVQDAFAHALTQRRRFRGGTPEAWLWRSVERRALDKRRELARTTELGENFDEAWLDSRRDPELARAVAALPPKRRLVVFLRYFADLSYAEIARVARVKEGTVAATLAQAHDELRVALEGTEVRG
jgi:RNA polymerase sigma factor (sigma-70 family)